MYSKLRIITTFLEFDLNGIEILCSIKVIKIKFRNFKKTFMTVIFDPYD